MMYRLMLLVAMLCGFSKTILAETHTFQGKFVQSASTDSSKDLFNELGHIFSNWDAKAAPVAVFSENKDFIGEECAESVNGDFKTYKANMIQTFANQGRNHDQNGLALAADNNPALYEDKAYRDLRRAKLIEAHAAREDHMEYIAMMDNDSPVRKGADSKPSLFYERSLLLNTTKSGPFHWIEYEIREVKNRDGEKDYMIKSTEKYQALGKWMEPAEIKRVTYCW